MKRGDLQLKLEDKIPKVEGKNIWIWGAGHTAVVYQEGLKRLKRIKICGYCDNDPQKWGEYLSGKPIISPKQLKQYTNICVLICSPQESIVLEVGKELDENGIEWYRLDDAVLKLYKEDVLSCYDMLDSELSKETYAHIIACHMENAVPDDKYISDKEYFCLNQFRSYGGETFIDCGAYVGDTLEQYIWINSGFRKIIAFEPDKKNFVAMEERVKRLKKEWNLDDGRIVLHCCGVGSKNKKIPFESNRDVGSMVNESLKEYGDQYEEIEVVSLDSFLQEPYSFLKADIESYEYEMLEGAKKGIIKNKPLLAICLYHNVADLFQIQLLIHSFVPEYRFAIRHHGTTLGGTILYAYMDNRIYKTLGGNYEAN